MTTSSAQHGSGRKTKATSWRQTPLDRVTDEEIDLLEPASLDRLTGLFEQYLAEDSPPRKKMSESARLQRAGTRRDQ